MLGVDEVRVASGVNSQGGRADAAFLVRIQPAQKSKIEQRITPSIFSEEIKKIGFP